MKIPKIMKGQRVYPNEEGVLSLSYGDYGQHERGLWLCRTPNGHSGNLSHHTVLEHDNKTITVTPSILVTDDTGVLWHGYLKLGVWREC